MKRENNNKLVMNWLEDIWEEVAIQFHGITVALVFFLLVYLIFDPSWMRPLKNFF
mgnify:CR=1 FL=1